VKRQLKKIDEEISSFIKTRRRRALKIIEGQKDSLEKIVALLLEKETIEKDEFEKTVGPKPERI
jgi:ATP-dependent Zn protease